VELPKSLKSNIKRNYSPQQNLLDGYSQLPRMAAPPYSNNKLQTKTDFSRRKRSIETTTFFKNIGQNNATPETYAR
jgi:hypothetical protein